MDDFAFDPVDGLKNTVEYETSPVSEARAREILQTPLDQIKTYLNGALKTEVTGKQDYKQLRFYMGVKFNG